MRFFKGLQSLAVWQSEVEQERVEFGGCEFCQPLLKLLGDRNLKIGQRVVVQGFFQQQGIGRAVFDQ